MAPTVTFIGYRGSGKSAVGAEVAQQLGWRFVDADIELERRAGCTIREIFETDGEAYFRALEEEVLHDLLSETELVVAAGGGAVLSGSVRTLLKRSGAVVFLRVSAEVAEWRIAADRTSADRRPALTRLPPRAEIETTLAVRTPLYEECATITLDADNTSIGQLAREVTGRLSVDFRRETAS